VFLRARGPPYYIDGCDLCQGPQPFRGRSAKSWLVLLAAVRSLYKFSTLRVKNEWLSFRLSDGKKHLYDFLSYVSSLMIAMFRPLFRLADAMGLIVISPVNTNRGFDAPMPKDLAQRELILRVIVEPTMSI
jgi:hypothetical protein